MKNISFLWLFCGATSVLAAPPFPLPPPLPPLVTEFRTYGTGLPLSEFLRLTIGTVSHKPYVLVPGVSDAGQLVSVDLKGYKGKDPLPLVRAVLPGLGYSMREVAGVLIVEPIPAGKEMAKPDLDLLVYTPRHRPVSALTAYGTMFPDLSFGTSGSFGSLPLSMSATPSTASLGSPGLADGYPTAAPAVPTGRDPSLLVVRGTNKGLKEFKDFLTKADTPVPEVVVRAYVFEVRNTDSKDSSIQLVFNLLGGKVSGTLGQAASDNSLRLVLPDISLAVRQLSGTSGVSLLSSPVLRAADGSSASATIGTDTPTLGSIVTSNGSTQQSVAYQSSGVILSVSPRIHADSIRMQVSQELSSFVATDTGLAATPTKLRRAFSSDVVLANGDAVLLGGLSELQQSESKTKGWFSGSKAKAKSQSDIVVLLQVQRVN